MSGTSDMCSEYYEKTKIGASPRQKIKLTTRALRGAVLPLTRRPQISISNLNLKSQTSDLSLPAGQSVKPTQTLLELRGSCQYSHRKSPNLSSQISRLEGRPNLQSQILDLERTRPQIPFGVGNLILQVSGL